MEKTLYLLPECYLEMGQKRAVIFDFKRQRLQLIPLEVAETFSLQEGYFELDSRSEYFELLLQERYVTEQPLYSRIPVSLEDNNPSLIEKCTLIYSPSLPLDKILYQLNGVLCTRLVILFDFPIDDPSIVEVLRGCAHSAIEEYCVVAHYSPSFESVIDTLQELINLREVTLYSSPGELFIHRGALSLQLREASRLPDCPYQDRRTLILDRDFYRRSKQYNNCLYKSIAITSEGGIKPCPLSEITLGTINQLSSLKALLDIHDLTKDWNCTKDKIRVCQSCELRYICLDCRFSSSEEYAVPDFCNYHQL